MAVDLATPVLVVDDSPTMGQILRKLLTLIGFAHVDNVLSGASALAQLRQGRYGLIISDWNMQPMSGEMLLMQIRADPSLKHIPVIVSTAQSMQATVLAAKD